MKRRDFITFLGGTVASLPLAAIAQRRTKLPTVGFLGSGTPTSQGQWVAALEQRLGELGWAEGRTVEIEVRWAEGRRERFAEIAAEFVRLNVDVIVTVGTEPVIAAKQATSAIPIVFTGAGDPVGSGLVASLARPGGNVTGLSLQQADLASKRIELLREVVPGVRRMAVMTAVGSNTPEIRKIQESAPAFGVEISTSEITQTNDIMFAVESLKDRADALYVCSDPFMNANRVSLASLAQTARLPTMHSFREYVEAGGLMSYGPSFSDLFRLAAVQVDKILRGAKPADIPVEQPTKFELIINLKTAKKLGLIIPATLLARADEVIE